ncbi:hypothetical protein [Nocardia sp. CA-145437]|uniref:hypothetical protein n=1 Tax=Nocardia sp. CA-145437 TaxID=3239980 RepID=UPI003D952A9F
MTTATTKTTDNELDVLDLIVLAVLNTIWHTATGLLVGAWWAILFPMFSVPLVTSLAVGWRLGWPAGAAWAGVSAAGIMLWRWKCPQMFERAVAWRARSRCLTWWRYRRQWRTRIDDCELTVSFGTVVGYPAVQEIWIDDITDCVHVRMLPGQSPADWTSRVDRLALVFGARECQARLVGPGLMELEFWHWDPKVPMVLDDGEEKAA